MLFEFGIQSFNPTDYSGCVFRIESNWIYPHGRRSVRIYVAAFLIKRKTPCGFWIDDLYGRERWISNTGAKRYAYPTIEEAVYSYYRRKRKYAQHLESMLERARVEAAAVKDYKNFKIQKPDDTLCVEVPDTTGKRVFL